MTEQDMLDRMVAPGQRRPLKPYREGVIQVLVTSSCDKSCFGCTQASNLTRPGKPWFMTPDQFEQAVRSLGFDRSVDVTTYRDGPDKKYHPIPSGETYFGVVGVFGGNPAVSPHFREYCAILRSTVPFEQRGLWCNNPMTVDLAEEMARTFNPAVSNLNVHLDRHAHELFQKGWPAAKPVGLAVDSRHSPPWVAMKDVVTKKCPDCDLGVKNGTAYPEGPGDEYEHCETCGETCRVPDDDRIRELISTCDINQHWSAMIGVFRGELRAWFCEVAGAQAILHQHEPDYPDTGLDPRLEYAVEPISGQMVSAHVLASVTGLVPWWQMPMIAFRSQVRKHCFDCGVPLRGYGELAQADLALYGQSIVDMDKVPEKPPVEQTSATHAAVFTPKRKGRRVEVVTDLVQLDVGRINKVNHYLQNATK